MCPGPIIAGRERTCRDSAVLERGGRRITVRGRFTVKIPAGTYKVTVDGCSAVHTATPKDARTLTFTRDISGLDLVPACAYPA